jgi:uncharacterized protein
MKKTSCFAMLALSLVASAAAQDFDFPETAITDTAVLAKTVPGLARQILAVYREEARQKYLTNLFALQIMSERYTEAEQSIEELRELQRHSDPKRAVWINVQYQIYARSRAHEASAKSRFEQAYQQAFREIVGKLDDCTSALVIREMTFVDESWMWPAVTDDLEKQKGKSRITLADALKLVNDYAAWQAYHESRTEIAALVAEDDTRRYSLEKNILVKTADGGAVCAMVMRPRARAGRLPALLDFTIYVDNTSNMNDVRQTASNGYIGVEGFTRGKACSPGKPIPYVHDGADAAALIDWITAQPWSDGRVGMYGGSYDGFTQWAAAKYMPKGLKALMPGVAAAPAIDVPMEGNVFWNFLYPWAFYTTDSKTNDDAVYGQGERWQKLNHEWYVSGRPYRDLDKIDGTPNPVFDEWLAHPDYDEYWQRMIPYGKEFARINIPVLATAGYYYGGPGAAVYYFSQLEKYAPRADHYLLIGPYDHSGGQFGVVGLLGQIFDSVGGLPLDPVAQIDISDDLRYQWFDYVFRSGPKPPLLLDSVNYEVTGANVWKHAPALAALSGSTLRLHLNPEHAGDAYHLSEKVPSNSAFVVPAVDLADRSDVDRKAVGGDILGKEIDTHNGIEFISDPLPKATELSGLFSGQLDFTPSKKDFDFEIDLYELTPHGDYVQLAPHWCRASYEADRSRRHLLKPGRRQRVSFHSARLMSRQLPQGSRIIAVLSIIKEPARQINYGTGRSVSDESIQDAGLPVEVKWYGDSYLDLPVGK